MPRKKHNPKFTIIAPQTKARAYHQYMTSDLSLVAIAKDCGISRNTLISWVQQERWSEKRTGAYNTAVSNIDQQTHSNFEKTIHNHATELEAMNIMAHKLLEFAKTTTDIKEIRACMASIKDSHAVSKTLLTINAKKQREHTPLLPTNPITFQFNVKPLGKTIDVPSAPPQQASIASRTDDLNGETMSVPSEPIEPF